MFAWFYGVPGLPYVLAIIMLFGSDAQADNGQAAHDAVSPSLVRLYSDSGQDDAGRTIERKATGFIVSKDGLVLTASELMPELDDSGWLGTVRIDATIESKEGQPKKEGAPIIDINNNLGLILLKLPPVGMPYSKVTLGDVSDIYDHNKIFYSSGYREGRDNPERIAGTISSRRPKSHLWTLEPQSDTNPLAGSPIYDEGGRVIGITTGAGGESKWNFVPIAYADMLLTHVRLSLVNEALSSLSGTDSSVASWQLTEELAKRLSKLAEAIDILKEQMHWSIHVEKESSCPMKISYTKQMPGEPRVIKGNYHVTAVVTDQYGNPQDIPPIDGELEVVSVTDNGFFCMNDILTRLWNIKDNYGWSSIDVLNIRIVPVVRFDDERTKELELVTFEEEYPNWMCRIPHIASSGCN